MSAISLLNRLRRLNYPVPESVTALPDGTVLITYDRPDLGAVSELFVVGEVGRGHRVLVGVGSAPERLTWGFNTPLLIGQITNVETLAPHPAYCGAGTT